MKSRKPFVVLLVSSALMVTICAVFVCLGVYSANEKDPFYSNYGDFGAGYIPLVKPYKAVKLFGKTVDGNEHKWVIELIVPPDQKELYYYLYIYDVTKIAIENQVIMAYSPDSKTLTDHDKRVGQKVLYWFVVVPDQNIETGFETEEEFLAYIQTFGIENPSWMDPDIAHQQLLETRCLDWIPDCK